MKDATPLLLKEIGTITLPAKTERVVARERFVFDLGENARVKISYLGDNFRAWFLEKIEEPAGEMVLRYAKLTKPSVDGPILTELGDTAETTLAAIYALMEQQENGEEGVLLVSERANIFYVRDVNSVLRAVGVYWFGDGWYVIAHSVAGPDGWGDGRRVFSRNSLVSVAV